MVKTEGRREGGEHKPKQNGEWKDKHFENTPIGGAEAGKPRVCCN